MEKYLSTVFLCILSLVSCTHKINDDIDDPDGTATVVMIQRQSEYTDSAFLGITGKNVRIDWGDGTTDSFPSLYIVSGQIEQNARHRYDAAKKYVVKITADDLTFLAANDLTQINLKRATQLKQLHIPGSYLRELDLSSNTLLEEITCPSAGALGKLDLSANTLLREVNVEICELQELNIKNCNKLESITCDNNRLTELDLSGNPLLKQLGFWQNNLTKIDVSKNPRLIQITGGNNRLTEVDLSFCPDMEEISLADNAISKLVMTPGQHLYTLNLANNKLSAIDVNNQPELAVLYLENNNISELDITNDLSLSNVDISGNLFSGASLNKIFTDLPIPPFSAPWIRITANPGTDQCNSTIATAKKWNVRTN
jgi:hypothetical protein